MKYKKPITLDFGAFKLDAALFDSEVARRFEENLPYSITLQQWGGELYGSIALDLGEEKPQPTIPPGGLAYTSNGNYLCIFFGQTPAWPVEYIGQIEKSTWNKLLENPSQTSVVVKTKE